MDRIILSINRPWDGMIFDHQKQWEMRKTRPAQDGQYEVLVYETQRNGGAGAVVGKFHTSQFLPIAEYSEQVGVNSCLTKDEFNNYASGNIVYAWVAENPKRFKKPVPLGSYGIQSPPQNWMFPRDTTDAELEEEPVGEPTEESISVSAELIVPEACVGICKCCGQIRTYSHNCGMTQEERDTDATCHCNCDGGTGYRRMERVKAEIDTMLGNIPEEVREHLIRSAGLVISGRIFRANIGLSQTISVKIQENSKGRIEIKVNENQSLKKEV